MVNSLKGAVERADLPRHYGWHIIGRHTYASWYMEDGGSIYALQKILGHESVKTTERYAHLALEYRQKEAEKISHRFNAIGDTWYTYRGQRTSNP
jgi:site-specific recombinase XerD